MDTGNMTCDARSCDSPFTRLHWIEVEDVCMKEGHRHLEIDIRIPIRLCERHWHLAESDETLLLSPS